MDNQTHTAASLLPSSSPASLKLCYVGRQLKDVQAPAAVLDSALVRRNCRLMLDAVKQLGVGFRAHVKTHKTVEVAKFGVGEAPLPVKLVASTLSEIEHLFPWLLECRQQGREVNVIYGFPVAPSTIPRLSSMARKLGEGTISLFVDHPDHVHVIEKLATDDIWPGEVPIFANIDVGYHRDGVPPDSKQLADIATAIRNARKCKLVGLYSHFGLSYSGNSPQDALNSLSVELEGLGEATKLFVQQSGATTRHGRLTLSVGASPTVTSVQNLVEGMEGAAGIRYKEAIARLSPSFDVELHAGVYGLLDLQQLATRARIPHSPSNPDHTLLTHSDIAFRILAEVASLYLDRGEKPEALIGSGSIVLGREPCKSYSGWGVLTPWPEKLTEGNYYDPEAEKTGWMLGMVSQEHGILRWEGPTTDIRPLELGQKVMVWPNHACIASANFDYYLVVDSESDDPNIVRDVWLRCRGW